MLAPDRHPDSTPAPPGPHPAQAPQRIRGMFGAITPVYDLLNRVLSGSLDRHWRARAAREAVAGLTPCTRLLDVATGTGDLAHALAQAARAQAAAPVRVTGVDFTRPMLRRARKKFAARDFMWVEGDGLRLPLADGAFDAATVAFGLRNMIDKPAALAEMARVVRPGGRVAILEFGRPRNRLLGALYDGYSYSVMPRVGRLVSGTGAYGYLVRSIRDFWPAEELGERMRQAGLTRIRIIPMLGGIVNLHIGEKAAR